MSQPAGNHARDFPLLSDEQTQALLTRVKQGDEEARDLLVKSNLRLVWNIVHKFAGRGLEQEDLFQLGSIGLLKAIDRFDESFGVKFSTYAVPMIIGEIRRYLRDDQPVRVSRSLKELSHRVEKAREELSQQLGREPTLSELSAELNMDREDIVMALDAVQTPLSLDEAIYQDDGDPIYLKDQVSSGEGEHKWVDKLALKEVINSLPSREKQILFLRYFKDMTQTQVAKIIGISQVQVSRLEKQTLALIRMHLEDH